MKPLIASLEARNNLDGTVCETNHDGQRKGCEAVVMAKEEEANGQRRRTMAVTEVNLVQAWLKANKPNQPCVMFRFWDDDEGFTSVQYFRKIFARCGEHLEIPDDCDGEYVVVDVNSAMLVYKLVQAVHSHDKWGESFYGWSGTTFYWSRD